MTTSTTTSIEADSAGLPPRKRRQRLFFALWPTSAIAEHLAALVESCHRSCGGRAMRQETLHLTLAFLGEVPDEDLPRLCAAACALSTAGGRVPQAFLLTLDRLGYWPHNGILWAGCHGDSTAVTSLAEGLAGTLRDAGFTLESRSFLPHVTLLRDAHPAELLPMQPIDWAVQDFVLVRSDLSTGRAAYETIGRWPLYRS